MIASTEEKKINLWLGGLITSLPLLVIISHFTYDVRDGFAFIKAAAIALLISTFFFDRSRYVYRKATNKGGAGSNFWSLYANAFYCTCLLIYGLAWIAVLAIILIRLSGIDYLSS